MSTYTTIQGDMWDSAAFLALGSEDYAGQLMAANVDRLGYYIFPAGVVLQLPELPTPPAAPLPPWKRVAG